ncbi:MAG TPA: ATP-binding protein [Chloroflexota bacterium]|nr:ATP-binding protein [Chloroflexota bacterium]
MIRAFLSRWGAAFAGGRAVASAGVVVWAVALATASFGCVAGGARWGLELGLTDSTVVVSAVRANGLAWDAGIRRGDRVIQVNGQDARIFVGDDLNRVARVVILDRDGDRRPITVPAFPFEVVVAILSVSLLFVGLVAVVHRWAVDEYLGLAFLIFGSAVATALLAIPAAAMGYEWAYFLSASSAVVAAASFTILFLIFPHCLVGARWAIALIIAIALGMVGLIAAFSLAGAAFPPALDEILWLWVAVDLVGGLIILILRARNPEDRRLLAPIIVGTAAGIAPLILLDAVPFVISHVLIVPVEFAALGLVGIPIGFTYAILRHRLFALDALVRQLLLRFLDVATLVAMFVLIWAPLRRAGVDDLVAEAIALILVAVVTPSLAARLRDTVDRSLYNSVFQAQRRTSFREQDTVQDLATAVTRQVRELVPVQWAAFIGRTVVPAETTDTTRDEDASPAVLVAIDGDAPRQQLRGRWVRDQLVWLDGAPDRAVMPVVSGTRTLAALVVGPRLNNTPLNRLDSETIRILVTHAAAPIEAALLREQAEDEYRFREGLSRFARELAAAGSVEQVLQTTVCQVNQLLKSGPGLIWLRDPLGRLNLTATDGPGADRFAGSWDTTPWAPGEPGGRQRSGVSAVARERPDPRQLGEAISRIAYRLGDVGTAVAIGVAIRAGVAHPFSPEDEWRAGEIVEHADGAFRRAHAIAQAAEAETLRQITKVRGEFLDVVSHDLQNPLTVIRGFAELLEMHLGDVNDDFITSSIASIVEATNTSKRLIDDLLTSARIEGGRLALNREIVDVRGFLTRLATIYRVLPDGDRIHVEAGDGVIVMADAARLEQMVGNLVTNALRYADAGPVTLRARRLSADEACIEVSDLGKGVSAEDQPKIWDRFYRTASGELRASRGAGVGLSVVRTLADLHGGRAELESTVGQGSTFRIVLPAAIERVMLLPAESARSEADSTAAGSSSSRS